MGRPKSSLILGGTSFLERALSSSAEAFSEVVVVARCATQLDRDGVTEITDESLVSEPSSMSGLSAALGHSSPGLLWVLAVDYPLLTPRVLKFLRSRHESGGSSITVPRWDGRLQMLCAGYDTSMYGEVERRLNAGELRMQSLCEKFDTTVIEENEIREQFPGEPLMNVNTPQDYQNAKELDDPTSGTPQPHL